MAKLYRYIDRYIGQPFARLSRASGGIAAVEFALIERERRAAEGVRGDTQKDRGEGLQELRRHHQLAPRPYRVVALQVKQPHGQLDQGVVEEPHRVRGIEPDPLQELMGAPVVPGVELLHGLPEASRQRGGL